MIEAVKYFTAIVDDDKKISRQQKYWEALRFRQVEIIEGTYRIDKGKRTEKQTDVNIATHIVHDCHTRDFDCVVLISNDSDFKTPLEFAKTKLNKQVRVFSPNQGRVAEDLKLYAATAHVIDVSLLIECRLPLLVRDNPKIARPPEWAIESPVSSSR